MQPPLMFLGSKKFCWSCLKVINWYRCNLSLLYIFFRFQKFRHNVIALQIIAYCVWNRFEHSLLSSTFIAKYVLNFQALIERLKPLNFSFFFKSGQNTLATCLDFQSSGLQRRLNGHSGLLTILSIKRYDLISSPKTNSPGPLQYLGPNGLMG